MADLIDRQAAIDAFVDLYDRVAFFDKEIAARAIGIIKTFKALPSAQPEIIRCKDCKYWSKYEYINGKLESFPWCELDMAFFKEDDFCSRAERRTDE